MALEKVKIVFYKITEFGYYSRGKKPKNWGGVDELIDDLLQWQKGLTLGDTALPKGEPVIDENGQETAHYLPSYLLSVEKNNTYGSMITIWNSVADASGQVASIASASKLGNVTSKDFQKTKVTAGHIPGFPTYFWILPDNKTIANIRLLEETRVHKEYFLSYMKAALRWKAISRYVTEETSEKKYAKKFNYTDGKGSKTISALVKFNLSVKQNASQKTYLIKNANKINKVHSKNSYLVKDEGEQAPLIARLLGLQLAPPASKKVVEITSTVDAMDVSEGKIFTQQELKSFIEDWEEGHQDKSEELQTEFDDIGFQLKGDSQINWLSHSQQRAEVPLKLEWLNRELKVVAPKKLLEELHNSKDMIQHVAQRKF